MKSTLAALLLSVSIAIPSSIDGATKINPGEVWKDTSGSHINAHGCCVVFHEGLYYWFGEDRTGSTSNGVSCYTSADLINWKRQGLVFKTSQALDPTTGKAILERPKVVYNPNTGKWVMYCHWENGNGYGEARVCVSEADAINGNYKFVDTFRPNNHDSRDQTVIVDLDGKGYHFCATDMNSNINIALLSDDFLSMADPAVETKVLKGMRLEAPAIIRKGDTYFGLFSECDGWNPTPGHRAMATEVMGDWLDYGNFCVDLGSANTYKSQSTYILKVEGYDNAYIYMGDRWNSSDVGGKSEYVWLPLSLRSGLPTVKWLDSWDMSVFANCDRWQRVAKMENGMVVRILDKYSDRWMSKPKQGYDIEDDNDETNIDFRLEATKDPYVWHLIENKTGYYLQSIYGIMTWEEPNGNPTQDWHFVLEDDGCYRIENANDGKCLSVSGSSSYAGSNVFVTSKGGSKSQSFGLYFDVDKYDYEVANMFGKEYRQQIGAFIKEQQAYEAQSGIENAVCGKANAYVADGCICIDGAAKNVMVCGVDGRVVYEAKDGSNLRMPVPAGVYIVSVDGAQKKLYVTKTSL